MRTFACLIMVLLLSACGGDSENIEPKTTDKTWATGQFMPSSYFANRCINPRSNDDYQDLLGTYVDENNWLRSWTHETYLWFDELPDIDPAFIDEPSDYFTLMKTNKITDSGRAKDRFHYAENTEEYIKYAKSGISASYGFNYILSQTFPPRRAFIIYSEANSPAAANNINRGAEIISIDGEPVLDGDPDILNAGLIPKQLNEDHTFVIKDLDITAPREVVLKSSEIETVPVHTSKIISQSNKKVGYLALNTFFVASAQEQLIEEIGDFKNHQINELVLDLRYNGGGIISLSADLGSMIAGNSALGSVYTALKFNNKLSSNNTTFRFSSTSSLNLSVELGTILPKLNLSRVYILSTINTASASEYLINGLRGIDFEVILIGATTTGKPYGWQPKDNCGTTYSIVQFKGENAKGFSDFTYGFVPSIVDNGKDQVRGCVVYDDLSQPLGNINENILETALYHIENNRCPTDLAQQNSKPNHPLSAVNGTVVRRYPATGLIVQ